MNATRVLSATAAAALAVAVFCTPAPAGPPLICHPFDIGDARCLPERGKAPSAAEAVEILAAERDVVVHMETLRRAAVRIGQDRAAALELVAALMARALDAETAAGETRGADPALRWLDAGYAVASLKQNGMSLDLPGGTASGVPGYAWVKRALVLDAGNAGLHFAAAMVTVQIGGPEHAGHLARARALAGEGTLLAGNIKSYEKNFTAHGEGRRG